MVSFVKDAGYSLTKKPYIMWQMLCWGCGNTFITYKDNVVSGKTMQCQSCRNRATSEENKKIAKEHGKTFASRSTVIHGDRYDYSEVDYKTARIKVTIKCPTHGPWEVLPCNHLAGNGCPTCGASDTIAARKSDKPAIFYVIYLVDLGLYKLGVTARTIKARYKYEYVEYEILLSEPMTTSEAYSVERAVINEIYAYNYKGDKVLGHTGNSEVFTMNPLDSSEVVKIINEKGEIDG